MRLARLNKSIHVFGVILFLLFRCFIAICLYIIKNEANFVV